MSQIKDQVVSLPQIARALFRTRSPSHEQIYRVYQLMKSGALPVRDRGDSPMKWTTTEAALADFLATQQLYRVKDPSNKSPNEASRQKAARLTSVYRGIWRDYFLAVMLRRRTTHRSVAFHRAVVAGQVLLLLVMVGVMYWVVSGVRQHFGLYTPPERIAIRRWIEENTDAYSVKQWHPTETRSEGTGVLVRVEYRYQKESHRWIHTDRMFNVTGNSVTEMSLE